MNNLRQLQLAWMMYPDDNEGALPANNYVNGFKVGMLTVSTGPSWCPGDAVTDTTTENIRKGLLYDYSKSTAIYRCPADTSKVQAPATDMFRTRSYKMSGSINCTTRPSPTYRKLNEIEALSQIFVFIDAHENSMVDPHFTLEQSSTKNKKWVDLPSSRHDKAGNLSFADGHIERWGWKREKIFERWQQDVKAEDAVTGEPSELSDFLRLQAAMRQP